MDREIQQVLILAAFLAAYVFKRFVLDKTLYKMSRSEELPVADRTMKYIYLPLKYWRRYYTPVWFSCACLAPLGVLLFWFTLPRNLPIVVDDKFFYFLFSIAIIIFPFIFWRKKVKNIKFDVLNTKIPPENSYRRLCNVISKNRWSVLSYKKDRYIQAESKTLGFSWGELITIIIENDRVLVSSITSPYKKPTFGSMGVNASNKDKVKAAVGN